MQRPRWGASGLQKDRGVWILFACLKSALRCEVDPSRKPWIHRPQEWPTSLPEEGVAGLWQICAPRLDESLSLRLQVNPREALFPPPLSPRERLHRGCGAAVEDLAGMGKVAAGSSRRSSRLRGQGWVRVGALPEP